MTEPSQTAQTAATLQPFTGQSLAGQSLAGQSFTGQSFGGCPAGDRSFAGMLPAGEDRRQRVRSGARRSVERLVLRELSRVRAVPGPSPLTPRTLLADAGIDRGRLLDATCRIEGHYQMRFRDEWLREIRSVGDLIGCVVARMFDGLDAAVERTRAGRVAVY